MPFFRRRPGESFIEVLVAVVIVGLSVAIALNLLINTTDNTNANRNFLIADNLATEGLEAVRNMIYTNVLKHGVENAEECWLVFALDPDNGTDFLADECSANQIVTNVGHIHESYLTRAYATPDLHWDFSTTNLTLDLEAPGAADFRLYTANFPAPIDDTSYYTNEAAGNEASPYYRSVKLELTGANEVTVTARVLWEEAGRVRSVDRTTLFNNANFTE